MLQPCEADYHRTCWLGQLDHPGCMFQKNLAQKLTQQKILLTIFFVSLPLIDLRLDCVNNLSNNEGLGGFFWHWNGTDSCPNVWESEVGRQMFFSGRLKVTAIYNGGWKLLIKPTYFSQMDFQALKKNNVVHFPTLKITVSYVILRLFLPWLTCNSDVVLCTHFFDMGRCHGNLAQGEWQGVWADGVLDAAVTCLLANTDGIPGKERNSITELILGIPGEL